jgi:hypothetical protein
MLITDLSIRNAQAEVVRAAAANGIVIVKTAYNREVVRVSLGANSFGAAVGGVTSLLAGHTGVVTRAGTAAQFELRRQDLSLILSGGVGVGVGDLRVDNTAVAVGDTFSLDGLSYVAPGA